MQPAYHRGVCGICAYVGMAPGAGAEALAVGVAALAHRGPDGTGVYSRDGVHLGQTRLQVVGDAIAGAQPARDDRYALVFNGEIHNYRELARECGLGERRTSDTAVLFELLRRRGMSIVPRLRGFWAFVFVDFTADRLVACRDRYGQKPLLYTEVALGTRAFASEAPALGLRLRPRLSALRGLATAGHYPTAPETFYEGVAQVRPGCYVTVDLKGLAPPVESRYYSLPPARPRAVAPAFGDAAAQVADLLRRSLALRLRADVPVGLTLSAGKDSGTLAALLPTAIATAFTFDSRARDSEAAEVNAWYGDRFRVATSRIDEAPGALGALTDAVHRRLDAPLASASLLALDSLYALARSAGVPVLLSGQGADEIFGGYNYYAGLQGDPVSALLARARTLGGPRDVIRSARDRRAASAIVRPIDARPHRRSPDDGDADADANANAASGLVARMRGDLLGAPLQTMLWYEDRLSMAHGIEARYPFLDADLVDFCVGLPGDYHVRRFARKRLLHAAFAKIWPAALRRGTLKRGLPAAEGRLLDGNPEWTHVGLQTAAEYLGIAAPPARHLGPRSAKTLFRLAAIGHWLRYVVG